MDKKIENSKILKFNMGEDNEVRELAKNSHQIGVKFKTAGFPLKMTFLGINLPIEIQAKCKNIRNSYVIELNTVLPEVLEEVRDFISTSPGLKFIYMYPFKYPDQVEASITRIIVEKTI